MYKYKAGFKIIMKISLAFILLSMISCDYNKTNTLKVNHEKGRYGLDVAIGAGHYPAEDKEILAPPFNLVSVYCCEHTKEIDFCPAGILLSDYLKPKTYTTGQIVTAMHFIHRTKRESIYVPIFLPLDGSRFKRLHDEQFRLRYDEMLSIVQDWYWNYLGYSKWRFESWLSEEAAKQIIKGDCAIQ